MYLRLLLIALAAFAATNAGLAQGWVNLFDGKTLNGWTVHSGTATYKADNGTVLGTTTLGSSNSFLCTDKEYGDYILEFEVKVDPKLNSGVQFRSLIAKEAMVIKTTDQDGKEVERKVPADRVYGYQVEIATKAGGNSGNVYDEARRARFLDDFTNKPKARDAFKDNQWNKYRIEVKGDSIKTFVNGVPCADFKDSMTMRGTIGLQVHGVSKENYTPLEVRWRKIRIKEL